MDRWLTRLIDAQGRWARPLGDFNHRWLSALFRPMPAVRDVLNGRWLGHPLHSVMTDGPIGILSSSSSSMSWGSGPRRTSPSSWGS